MGVRKDPKEGVAELNNWLAIFLEDNTQSENKTLYKKHKTEMTRFYGIKRKLIALGRIDSKKRVLSTKPVTEEEFKKVGGAYGINISSLIEEKKMAQFEKLRKKKKKVAKKKVVKKKTNGLLKDPLEIPVMEHPAGATITVTVPVKELVEVFLQMIRTGGRT